MKLCKKIAAAALAAVSTVTCVAATANAEATKQKLLTAELSEIDNANHTYYFGDGYVGYNNTDDPNVKSDMDGLVHINLEKWRETGKLSYTKVESDLDMTDLVPASGGFANNGSYMQFRRLDADEKPKEVIVAHLDKENNKLSTAYTYEVDNNLSITSPDGYTFFMKNNNKETSVLTYSVYSPDGTQTEDKTISYANEEWDSWQMNRSSIEKYVAVLQIRVAGSSVSDGYDQPRGDFEMYGVCKDGSLEKVNRTEGAYQYHIDSASNNYISWRTSNVWGLANQVNVYTEDGKTHTLSRNIKCADGTEFFIQGLMGKIFGTRAIAYSTVYNDGEKPWCALIDIEGNTTVSTLDDVSNALSKAYRNIITDDGEMYLVQTNDGKWGFIDNNGNEIKTGLDYASGFNGDYAPVVQGGKGSLIDKNMNRVTVEVDGVTMCNTVDDGFYVFSTNDGGMLFATYSNETVAEPVSDPESSAPASEPASTEPTSQPDNPTTGVGGIAFAVTAAAIAGCAVIVARRKK